MDKYNRFMGTKKGLLEKYKDKFRSLINRLKQKGYINIKFISKEEEKENYNDDDIEIGFIRDIVAGYSSSEETEINSSESDEEKKEERKQEYELYNMYRDEYKNEELKIKEQIERLRNEDVARFLDENKMHNFELKPRDARKIKISDKETMIKLKGLGDRSVKYYYNNFIERYNHIYGEEFISAFLDIYENKEVPKDEDEIIREVREYIIDVLKYNLDVEEKNKEIKTNVVISEDGEEKNVTGDKYITDDKTYLFFI